MNLSEEKREEFDNEVNRWIEEGILVPWEGEFVGVISLMATDGFGVPMEQWWRMQYGCRKKEASFKGLNLGLHWDFTSESLTVYRWIVTTLSEEGMMKTKCAAEKLIKRRCTQEP